MEKPKLYVNEKFLGPVASSESVNYLSMYGTNETPMMELRADGDIMVKGEKVMSNKEVAEGLLTIFYGGKLPTDQLNVRVLKPLGYYDNHAPGETLHIKLSDATQLIKDGYVEIVVNEKGCNM